MLSTVPLDASRENNRSKILHQSGTLNNLPQTIWYSRVSQEIKLTK